MCGIYACVSTTAHQPARPALEQLLRNRGPDHLGVVHDTARVDNRNVFLSFTSTVLALRGGSVTLQPFVDDTTGSVLCWNGEAWRIDHTPVTGNDGQVVFQLLMSASSSQAAGSDSAVADAIRRISGPFALVFFDKPNDLVYFCRDRLGRRSLLCNESSSDSFQLASVADANGSWREIEADGMYVLSCGQRPSSNQDPRKALFHVSHLQWSDGSENQSVSVRVLDWLRMKNPIGALNRAVSNDTCPLTVDSVSVSQLEQHLRESLVLRVLNVPHHTSTTVTVAILFSGGLDCTMLARLAHELMPIEQEIDLLNVAFENPRVVAARKKSKTHGTMEAELDEYSPYDACPDRLTGRKAFAELQSVCPGRSWRFVEINIPYSETTAHRSQVITLIAPHQTEMDLSIAYALYFASRGVGLARLSTSDTLVANYATPARVLLSGLGADELFGGYTRHATAFTRGGLVGLIDELELDVNRLGKRNLGRDDRVISHWGHEARFPYLDEKLVSWALQCPVQEKCGFGSESGHLEAGKLVLRLLATKLGMTDVAKEKKRAIQFGARTAKMETGQTKGTTLIS